MKIDRIEQIICTKNVNLNQQIKSNAFVLTPISENMFRLKTNPGKLIYKDFNLGASPTLAEVINYEITYNLRAKILSFEKIEYCIDIEVPFKLTDHKHILNTFNQAFYYFNYRLGKLDFNRNQNLIESSPWKGVKGYKTSRTIKLYSKCEEKNICSKNDIIRMELTFGKRAIKQNHIENISNIQKAVFELSELLFICEKCLPKKLNRYTIQTSVVIKLFKNKLKNISF